MLEKQRSHLGGYHTPLMTLFLFLHVKFQMFRRQQMVIQVDRNANNFIMWFLKITAMPKKEQQQTSNHAIKAN